VAVVYFTMLYLCTPGITKICKETRYIVPKGFCHLLCFPTIRPFYFLVRVLSIYCFCTYFWNWIVMWDTKMWPGRRDTVWLCPHMQDIGVVYRETCKMISSITYHTQGYYIALQPRRLPSSYSPPWEPPTAFKFFVNVIFICHCCLFSYRILGKQFSAVGISGKIMVVLLQWLWSLNNDYGGIRIAHNEVHLRL
jgi:hypothetical protein